MYNSEIFKLRMLFIHNQVHMYCVCLLYTHKRKETFIGFIDF